jgi:hypothetical protein
MWLAFLFIMLIGIASLALAVNWAYGLLLQQHQQRLCDLLAVDAVHHLLDDDLLADAPVIDALTNQADDVTETNQAIFDNSTGLLAQNNNVTANPFHPAASDVTLTFGSVDDASQGPLYVTFLGVYNFDPSGTSLYNTLRVDIRRDPASMRRVFPLVRGIVRDSVYDLTLSASSLASIDSRVVGFRPIESSVYPDTNKNAPVLPIAVSQNAWFNVRPGLGDLHNGNGRKELWVELKDVPADPANAALIDFDLALSINTSDLPNQIQTGLNSSLVTTGTFGPIHPSLNYRVDATQQTPSNLAALKTAFTGIIGTNQAKRVLPIYNTFANPLKLEGFVGVEILDVDLLAPRLRILVEPAFVIHSTAVTQRFVTDSLNNDNPVDENLYVHKVRLTQ